MTRDVRVGLLAVGGQLPAWLSLAIAKLLAEPGVSLVAVLETGQGRQRGGLMQWAYEAIDRRAFRVDRDAFATEDLNDGCDTVPRVKDALKLHGGGRHALSGPAAQLIADVQADLWLDLGWRAIPIELLRGSKCGVLSFGFDGTVEVLRREPVTHSALILHTEDRPQGVAVLRSYSATDPTSPVRSRNAIAWKLAAFPARAARSLHKVGSLRPINDEHNPGETAHEHAAGDAAPGTLRMAGLLVRHAFRYVGRKVASLRGHDQWILMFARAPRPSSGDDCRDLQRVQPPRDRFWADPSVIYRDGRHFVFFEEFEYAKPKAHISVLEIGPSGSHTPPEVVLERPYHLSYPHLFEYEGELFMIPETANNRTIELYRCVTFPGEWRLEQTLLEDIQAVDATIVRHAGRYWMFACVAHTAGASLNDELHLFHAESPVGTSWEAHPQNPVVSDVRRARPAGALYFHGGRLYRPSQDCSVRYGYGMHINQVDTLTVEQYGERSVAYIGPTWAPDLVSTHTLNHGSGMTIMDGEIRRSGRPA